MRIVTNPGSNLTAETELACDLDLVPQLLMVDGFPHDARTQISHQKVDQWLQRAEKYPQVLGTPVDVFKDELQRLAERDREILVVMTSRKLIESHDNALEAAAQVKAAAKGPPLRIEVVDSRFTDVMTGLSTLLAAEARKAGRPLDEIVALLNAFAAGGAAVFALEVLENIVKGGRASFLAGWLGNALNIRPLIGVIDGQLQRIGRYRPNGEEILDKVTEQLVSRVTTGQKVWVGIAHGSAPERARALLDRLRQRYDVAYSYVRPLSPSIYLHLGPGALVGSVFPIGGLAWSPTTPTVTSEA